VFAKAILRHEDLTANGKKRWMSAAKFAWDRSNLFDLGGYVIAFVSIATGGCTDKITIFVDDFERDTVKLWLTDVADRCRVKSTVLEPSVCPLVECSDIGFITALIDRQHWCGVFDRFEFVKWLPTDPLCWAVR